MSQLFQHLRQSPRHLTLSLAAAAVSMLSAGTHYTFPLFGPRYADAMGYSALETTHLATAWNYGVALSGPGIGVLVDTLGPRYISWTAAVSLATGYAVLAAGFKGDILIPSVTYSTLLFFLLGVGNTCAYMSAISTTAHNFPTKLRGTVLGIVISCFGLSGYVVSLIDRIWFANHNGDASESDAEPDTYGLMVTLAMLLGTVNFLAGFALRKHARALYTALPLENGDSVHSSPSNSSSSSSFSVESEHADEENVGDARTTPFAANPDAWLLFTLLLVVCGSGLMYINNIGSICEMLLFQGFPKSKTPAALEPSPGEVQLSRIAHVGRFSVASATGRLVIGWISDRFLVARSLPLPSSNPSRKSDTVAEQRVPFTTLASLIIGLGLTLCAFVIQDDYSLRNMTTLIGFGYGCVFTLIPTMVSEWWGTDGFAWRWGWLTWAPSIGAQFLNAVFGAVVDSHSEKTDSGRCELGRACYSTALSIGAGMCALGMVVTVWLWWRKRTERANLVFGQTLGRTRRYQTGRIVRESIHD